MKKPRKFSVIFTILIVLFAVFSPNLLGQKNTAQAYCRDSGYGTCLVGWGSVVTVFCGGISFLLNANIPICILTVSGGAGSGNDLGSIPGIGYTCMDANLGLNPVANFAICESIALTLVGIRCNNDHKIPCVCTGTMSGTMCSGDNTNLLNNRPSDGNLAWMRVGNYSSNCTTRKCEYYTPVSTPGICGNRARTYTYNETNWSTGSAYCSVGTTNRVAPFPSAGGIETWACIKGGVSSPTCVATRGTPPSSYNCIPPDPTDGVTNIMCPGDNVGLSANIGWQNVGVSSANCGLRKCEYYTPPVIPPTSENNGEWEEVRPN